GLEAEVLAGEEPARAPHPGLDLVEEEQRSGPGAKVASLFEEARRRGRHSRFALHRLDQDRAGLFRDGGLELVRISVVDEAESLRQRTESLLVLRLPRGRERPEGAAVERVVHADDL